VKENDRGRVTSRRTRENRRRKDCEEKLRMFGRREQREEEEDEELCLNRMGTNSNQTRRDDKRILVTSHTMI
jgi:hypothetical protein